MNLTVLSLEERCVEYGGDVTFLVMCGFFDWGAGSLCCGVGGLHGVGCGAVWVGVEDHHFCDAMRSRSGLRGERRGDAQHRRRLPRWRYDVWLVVKWMLGGWLLIMVGVGVGIGWRLAV
jgi:hypothetical protein